MSSAQPKKVLSIFTLTMINIAAIASLRNLPMASSFGFSIIFVYIVMAILFLIPSALVSAELATTYHKTTGGVFKWVEEAFGPKWGFMAIWMQFIENVIWFPTGLSFVAATLAYIIDPALAQNKLYMILVILSSFWGATYINLKGMKASGLISTIGAIFGTLIPGALIITLGLIWWIAGKPLATTVNAASILPKMNLSNLVFVAGILFSFSGMEMSAVHAKEVQNPNKNYPKAILVSSIILVVLLVMGSLAISFVVSPESVSLVSGLMEAFRVFFNSFKIGWFTPLLAFLVALGVMSQASTWLIGPVKGIYATAHEGLLPKIFDKTNKENVPYMLLFFQGTVVTLLSFLFFFMPDVNSTFWILSALATQLYLVMYVLLFASAIYLRYKKPKMERPYKVFGGNAGMNLVAGVGGIVSLSVFFLGFVPPEQLNTGSIWFYEGFLIGGLVLFGVVPFLAIKKKRAHQELKLQVSA